MSTPEIPETVLGVAVRHHLDSWTVDDLHGSRSYCKVRTADGREVTLLCLEDEWRPTIVTTAPAPKKVAT